MRRVIVSFAVAACWVLCSLAPAAAEDSLPQNGKIAFAGSAPEDCGPGCESSSENWDIYTVNADGSDLVKITNDPSAEMDPAWSPDGTKIAYTRDSKDGDAIYVMNADGTGQKRLTNSSRSGANPSWSPDGSKIAFGDGPDILVMDAGGCNVRRLTAYDRNGLWSVHPSWSPDGKKLAFQSTTSSNTNDSWEIHTMNVDGTGKRALTNNDTESGDFLPEWSPDARRIVFQGSTGIEIVNADGTEQRTLNASMQGKYAWSPNGKKIALAAGDEIATINPDGSGLATIKRTPDMFVIDPDWQPLPGPTESKPETMQGQCQQNSLTVHQPDTGGLSLLWVAIALLFSGGVIFYAMVRPRM